MNDVINKDLTTQIAAKQEFGLLICQKLTECINQIGFSSDSKLSYPDYATARFSLLKDPYTGQFNLNGVWYDRQQQKLGQVQFQSDDTCYAEYTIALTHPTKPQWFVDTVTAWGKQDNLKAEANLLRFPE